MYGTNIDTNGDWWNLYSETESGVEEVSCIVSILNYWFIILPPVTREVRKKIYCCDLICCPWKMFGKEGIGFRLYCCRYL
jgi:hypothetical protein